MKRYAREQLIQIERDLKRIHEEEAYTCDELDKLDSIIKMYDQLGKKVEVTSDYRKRLNKIVDLQMEYEERLADITQPKKYFEKSAELTESEQMKIIFKILTEQEETLTKEIMVREILDMEHYKDYIWVTVQAPPRLWSEDLSQELYTALAAYVTSEVSRTITVRVIESRDPWITRVLVVGGRGKAEHLEAYDEMQLLHSKSNEFERNLSRSYLLEHGTSAIQVINEINNNMQKKK